MRISAKNPLIIARERLVISRFELARKAGVSMLTLARIEEGKPCRIDTKRRIAEALGSIRGEKMRSLLLLNDRRDDGAGAFLKQ